MNAIHRMKHLIPRLLLSFRIPYLTDSVRECPICRGASEPENCKRRSDLWRCTVCDHVYAASVPRRLLLEHLYGGMQYWLMDKGHQGIQTIAFGSQWDGFLEARMAILVRAGLNCNGAGKKNIFEIGCSEGMLVANLQRCGHKVAGCDMNAAIVARGKQCLGVDIVAGAFEGLSLPVSTYDFVISFHTLEHMRAPETVFDKITKILRVDGTVVIEVPGGKEEYGTLDHLHFFSRQSLERLIATWFEKVEIIENSYTNSNGDQVCSYYGSGRYPRKLQGNGGRGLEND